MKIKLLTLGPQNFYPTSMVTPETKPKTKNPNLMLQWNYEHKTFDTRTTKLLPVLNGDPRSNTKKNQNLKPKSQISCYNGTMNIKLLTLGPQNFYHTSMLIPDAKPKTQIRDQPNAEHVRFGLNRTRPN